MYLFGINGLSQLNWLGVGYSNRAGPGIDIILLAPLAPLPDEKKLSGYLRTETPPER